MMKKKSVLIFVPAPGPGGTACLHAYSQTHIHTVFHSLRKNNLSFWDTVRVYKLSANVMNYCGGLVQMASYKALPDRNEERDYAAFWKEST